MKYDVVIVASGKGERAKLGSNKVFFKMADGKTVLEHSASLFIQDDDCQKIIIVTSQDCIDSVFKHDKVTCVLGGKERRNSVENGLNEVSSEYVLIHDAARPFLHKQALQDVKKEVEKSKATILARKATDTIKVVEDLKPNDLLSQNILAKHGIREPLYLSALKMAGCEIHKEDKPSEEQFVQEELDRVLVPVEDEKTAKQINEYKDEEDK